MPAVHLFVVAVKVDILDSELRNYNIYIAGTLRWVNILSQIVHEPEGQSVLSQLNKVHCALWEDIHPNNTKTYDSSAVKVF